MTTIAWDGKTLAVDSRLSMGNYYTHYGKLHKYENGYYAVAGNFQDYLEFKLMLEGSKGRPSSKSTCVFTDGKKVFIIEANGFIWEPNVPHAEGTGSIAAMSAMLCGKTAPKAIEIAAMIDSATGGKISSVKVQ